MYELNILGTVLAAIAAFMLGWAWYSNALFGKTWRRLSGVSEEQHLEMSKNKARMWKVMSLYFVSLLILAGFISYFLNTLLVVSIGEAWKLMACVWFGVALPATIGSVLWERRSWTFYAINVFYTLGSMLLISAVLLFV